MNKQQRRILRNFVMVMAITAAAVVAMINFRVWVNHAEAMRAMEHLGRVALQYRADHGSVPPQSYVDRITEQLEGYVRLGKLYYRARWIGFEATDDEILAYTRKDYRSLLVAPLGVLGSEGYIVLRLDGGVEWMAPQQFEPVLARQQSPMEIEMTKE